MYGNSHKAGIPEHECPDVIDNSLEHKLEEDENKCEQQVSVMEQIPLYTIIRLSSLALPNKIIGSNKYGTIRLNMINNSFVKIKMWMFFQIDFTLPERA